MGHVGSSRGCAIRRGRLTLWVAIGTVIALCLLEAALAPSAQALGGLQISVVDQASHAPVVGVELKGWSPEPPEHPNGFWGVTGDYVSVFQVPAGTYYLLAEDRSGGYASQFWNGKATAAQADTLTVVDGETTTCVVEMTPAGHVAGTVVDSSGRPLQGIYICVTSFDYDKLEFGGQTWSDAAGHYAIGGLPSGSYTIEAQDFTCEYLYQFYPDQRSRVTATPFDVVAGQTLQAPVIVMKHSATVRGGITTRLGIVPHDVQCAVEARQPDGSWKEVASHCCYNDCTYLIFQIPPGRYRICYTWDEHPSDRQYYPGTFDPSRAKIFDIAEGEHLTGLDVVMWGDTRAPVAQAPLAGKGRLSGKADLAYRVVDKGRHGPTADVTIKVKTFAGKTVKVLHLAKRPVNQLRRLRFACKLPKGRYRYFVYAVDCGGNHQKRIGRNTLTVR